MNPQTKTGTDTDKDTDGDSPGQLWKRRYEIASGEQMPLFEKFKDWFDVMYAVKSTKGVAPWRSKIYIPILASKAWDFITKLSDLTPRFDVTLVDDWDIDPATGKVVFDDEALQRCIKIAKKLEKDYNDIRQDEAPSDSLYATLIDATVTGTGIAKVGWSMIDNTYKAHEMLDDGVNVDTDEEIQMDVTEGFNYIEPVSIFNVFAAPQSASVQKAPWIMIREFKTLEELKDSGLYENLDQLSDDDATTTDKWSSFSYARNRLLNAQDKIAADKTVKFFELFECYDCEGNIKTFIGSAGTNGNDDAWLQIRDQSDVYWHGRKPLQEFYIRKKPYTLWGESLFENNETLQYAVNDVLNHYMDNLNISLDGGVMMDENAFVEDYVVSPGFTLFYKNEKPDQFKFPEPNPAQLSTVMNTLEGFVENATVPAYAGGTANSHVDKTQGTATGISKIMEAAQDKLGFMRSNFKKSLRQVGVMWLSNAQQFMDEPEIISNHNGNNIEPMMVTPADLQGRYNVDIDDDSMTPVSKSDERDAFMSYVGQLLAMQKASQTQATVLKKSEDMVRVDFNAIIKEMSVKFGQKKFSQYLLQAPSNIDLVAETVKEQIAQSELTMAAYKDGSLTPPMPQPPRTDIRVNADVADPQTQQILERSGYQFSPQGNQAPPDPNNPQQVAQTASQAAPTTPSANAAQTGQTMANPLGK